MQLALLATLKFIVISTQTLQRCRPLLTSLKFLMAMILTTTLVFTMLSWYATKKYYEAQEEQRYRKKTFEITAVTTGTIDHASVDTCAALFGIDLHSASKVCLMSEKLGE